jgi:DNA-binding NarL/FixJ family response regulator
MLPTALNEGNISAALLDIRLTLESVVPVATQLMDRRIPFVFYTGYVDTDEIREKFPHCEIVHKPASPEILVDAIAEVLGRTASPPRYIRRRLILLVIGLVVIVTLVLCIY